MKLTRHNGRAGKNGVYNPKHNDRNFKIENAEHIDPELAKQDFLWDCYQGFATTEMRDREELSSRFEKVEQAFYSGWRDVGRQRSRARAQADEGRRAAGRAG